MVVMRLKHLHTYKDVRGKQRTYLKIPGRKAIPIHGKPGTPEFIASYNQAVQGLPPRARPGDGKPGTIRALLEDYYKSADFTAKLKSAATRRSHKSVLERFANMTLYGERVDTLPVGGFDRKAIDELLDKLAQKPGAYETTLKRVRKLFAFAVDRGKMDKNPAAGIGSIRVSDGFEAWSDEDVAKFEAKWPSGTKERLAMALFLYTGQRLSDVVSMGRQHVRENMIYVVQQKTKTRLSIPIHPTLTKELPATGTTFLLNAASVPFSTAGFGNWFSDKARKAGLVGRTAHGLRKTAASRLAELGCSAHEIMSITGHKSLSEVEHYTKAANQITLAKRAMDKMR